MAVEFDSLFKPGVDRIEIELTDAQLIDMDRSQLQEYETLFRTAFDYGLWVTHWHDDAFHVTHYVISREPKANV